MSNTQQQEHISSQNIFKMWKKNRGQYEHCWYDCSQLSCPPEKLMEFNMNPDEFKCDLWKLKRECRSE